ncbi:hypothetical protein ABT095_19255 [Kitasatospora sp. NPDC002227]|uniref:cupin domain-containing protein n=1 Tax=Kitasatospora sp. NPDC002227 TaxID=3154773 RepID=UPI0033200213
MTDPGPKARLLADLAERVAAAGPQGRGALWRLGEPERQLDANLVRLPAGAVVGEHRENDLDVLLLVVAGGGTLLDGPQALELGAGALAWLPRGSRRSLRAGSEGLVYLTAHRRRPGMAVGGVRTAQLCPGCGAVPEGAAPAYCSRCGGRLSAG